MRLIVETADRSIDSSIGPDLPWARTYHPDRRR